VGLRGFSTINFWADDVETATAWYQEFLGFDAYWHVDDLEATVERLLSMGATQCQPITPHGDSGFVTASVVDPFGNVLGVMNNPDYLDVLASIRQD
jgi:catechol 2,3-dioxygenase-like lactoylglutathione lyase family enzyme